MFNHGRKGSQHDVTAHLQVIMMGMTNTFCEVLISMFFFL